MRGRALVTPIVTALVLLAGSTPAQAVAIPGYSQYPATLDVSGRYVVTVHDDTTARCAPGQNITLTTTVDLEMGRARDVEVTVTKQIAGVSPARSSGLGEVDVRTALTSYSETNYCDQPPQPLVKPACGEASGDIVAALSGLAEDGKFPLSLSVGRVNGGHLKFAPECPIPSLSVEDGYGLTTFPAKGTGMLIPLGVSAQALRRLKRGKALARRVSIAGPCRDVGLTSAEARIALPPRQSCDVDGHVWMRLKRVARSANRR